MATKCIFLDRDGVINKDYVDYTYTIEKFEILNNVIPGLKKLKEAGYLLIIITNQSGIAKGIYKHEDVHTVHNHFQKESGGLIDRFYYSPYHQSKTESLTRKPGSLMFEKAVAKFNIDLEQSWMIGDRGRDLTPAKKLGIRTIQVLDETEEELICNHRVHDLLEAANIILSQI